MAKLKNTVRKADRSGSERTPAPMSAMVHGATLFIWDVFAFLGLVSYRWTDIPANCAGADVFGMNWFGALGARHSYWLYLTFGFGAWFLLPIAGILALFMIFRRRPGWRWLYALVFIISGCSLLQLCSPVFGFWMSESGLNIGSNSGGSIGLLLCDRLVRPWLGVWGAAFLFAIVFLASLVMFVGPSNIMSLISREERLYDTPPEHRGFLHGVFAFFRDCAVGKKLYDRTNSDVSRAEGHKRAPPPVRVSAALKPDGKENAAETKRGGIPLFRKEDESNGILQTEILLPPTKLLNQAKRDSGGVDEREINEKSEIIEKTLRQFNIDIKVTNVVSGPVVTRYELRPPVGVRVDRINTYANDIQMGLKATSVRLLCPIPGRDVMGIEVPNNKRRAVSMREMVESNTWLAASERMALPLLLGVDLSGEPMLADLAKMPHMLVAGTTGSGKSVCLNAILAGFLMTRTPDVLRLLMVDPKLVEFTQYQGLPHLEAPIITNAKCTAAALDWSIAEMHRRLKLFRKVNVRNITAFNNRMTQTTIFGEDEGDETIPKTLPYIVIVIDEMADLMLDTRADVERRVVKLAQLSRAAGIHMILATQRPSVNVITGMIKANFPARVAFKVVQAVDSRTILDVGGAEHLIGMGDMLFSNPTNGTISRAQGVWIADNEVDSIVNWLTNQAEPEYDSDIRTRLDKAKDEADRESTGMSEERNTSDDEDEETQLMQRALEVLAAEGRVSTSFIQRKLRIGYNRAARIMDALEERGCISPQNASGGRELLRTSLENPMVDVENDFGDTSDGYRRTEEVE